MSGLTPRYEPLISPIRPAVSDGQILVGVADPPDSALAGVEAAVAAPAWVR